MTLLSNLLSDLQLLFCCCVAHLLSFAASISLAHQHREFPMNRVTTAMAIVAALSVGTSVAVVSESRPAEAAEVQAADNWSGQTRTLRIWPTGTDQAVGAGVVRLRYTYPGTISKIVVGSGWRVEERTASSFVLTNTVGFVARSWNRNAASDVGVRVDGNFRLGPAELEYLAGGTKIMTGDDFDRGRISMR